VAAHHTVAVTLVAADRATDRSIVYFITKDAVINLSPHPFNNNIKMKTATTTARKSATATKRAATSAPEKKTATAAKTSGKGKKLLEKLFVDMLKDIYWAEDRLIEALQQLEEAATSDELKEAFEDHRYTTQKHKSRLEKVFQLIGETAEAKKCEAMAGLVEEAKGIIEETEEGTMTRDAALIIAAQKVEHYEIATYGSLVQLAITLGHDKASSLLQQTLWEEEDTDHLLTDIAESDINPLADDEGEEDEEQDQSDTEEEEM